MKSMDKKVQKKEKGFVPPDPPVTNPSGQPEKTEPKPNEHTQEEDG